MVRIEGTRWDDGGKAVFDLQVSASDELPDLGQVIAGLKVAAGTIAQVIQTGKWYTLDADGDWYDKDGNLPEDDD